MLEIELSARLLNEIVENHIDFKHALRRVIGDENKKYLSTVSAITGCEIRHYYFFEELIKNLNVDLTLVQKQTLQVCLAELYFSKKLNEKDVKNYLETVLGDKYSGKVQEAIEFNGQISDILKDDKEGIDYISIRFNTPKWLVKMWGKHFGTTNAYKAMKANNKRAKVFVRVNSNVEKDESLFDEKQFVPTDIYDVFEYIGSTPIKKHPAITSGSVYLTKPEIKQIFDKYINPFTREYTLYNGEDDTIFDEVIVRSRNEGVINFFSQNKFERNYVLKRIRNDGLKNIGVYDATDITGLRIGLSQLQEVVILNPKSTSFNHIRSYPDYLINFDKNNIDKLINGQRVLLNDLSGYILNDGLLIYIVDTLNKKEGSDMIASFLKEHDNFELLEEKQCFPFDKYDTALYYAVMRVKTAEND